MLLILGFHEIAEQGLSPWIMHPHDLDWRIRTLKAAGYTFRSLHNALDKPTANFMEREAVLTFDDGRIGNATHARKVLADHGVPAVFYVCPGFVEGVEVPDHERYTKFMDWGHIQDLAAAGHEIGGHSMHHINQGNLTRAHVRFDANDCWSAIRRQLPVQYPLRHYAFPYGGVPAWSYESDFLLAGWKSCVTTMPRVENGRGSRHDPMRLSRWCPTSDMTLDGFIAQLSHMEHSAWQMHPET